MKPVTELYEAAEEAAGALESEAADDLSRHGTGEALLKRIGALDMVAAGSVGTSALLHVLDLVATLPSERLSLVRWAAGLSDADCSLLRWALDDGVCNASAKALLEDSQRLRAMSVSLRAALSGGEVGAKCPECHGAGKVKRLEGGGSVRVVKYDPCPKCAEGEGGAKDERWSCPGIHRWVGGGDYGGGDAICGNCGVDLQDDAAQRPCGAKALEKEKPKPTILRAGKPPPFLRVGMVLVDPRGHCTLTLWSLDMSRDTWLCRGSRDGVFERERASVLLTWLLAEPFAVEGES